MATSPSGTADGNVTTVPSSATSVSILAANSRAVGRAVFNDSTAVLYLRFGSGSASTGTYTAQVAAGVAYPFPLPLYRGAVTGIWASANGNARVTEY